MRDTTLDLNQIKELADYVAKRSASVGSQPLQVKTFVKSIWKHIQKHSTKFLNLMIKEEKNNLKIYKLILLFSLIS